MKSKLEKFMEVIGYTSLAIIITIELVYILLVMFNPSVIV